MRPLIDADVAVVDLSRRCHLTCPSCTRDVGLRRPDQLGDMTPDTFRAALNSLRDWWKLGRVIGLIGGEPLNSKHFREICEIFRDEWHPGELTHGRQPIADFNAFAMERLFDRSNGKGLWTSFGPKWPEFAELVLSTFSHWNPNSHEAAGARHQISLVDADEMCEAIGIHFEQFPEYRDRCWVANTWSPSITPEGKAWFCERAASIADLLGQQDLGWDIREEPHWWKRTPDQYGEQLSMCNHCSLCLPGPSVSDQGDKEIIGKKWFERLKEMRSPAVMKNRYEIFDPEKHLERRTVDTKDSYVAPSGIRVSNDNPYIHARKLSCVVVSVNRADHLAQTLPRNLQQVDELIVVTTSDSEEEDRFATLPEKHGNLKFVISDRCYEGGDAFNKGKMLNAGLAAIKNPDWVLLTDADCYLPLGLRDFLREHVLNPGVLYGVHRINTNAKFDHVWGTNMVHDEEPNGFFQLFNKRASAICDRWPNVMAETFCSAGGVDSFFLQQFDHGKRVMIQGLQVAHIDHGPELGAAWNGRSKGHRWRQVAMLMPHGLAKLRPVPREPTRIRFTDTLYGNQIETELAFGSPIPEDILHVTEAGEFLFGGKNIGRYHIHVAALCAD